MLALIARWFRRHMITAMGTEDEQREAIYAAIAQAAAEQRNNVQ